MDRKTELLTILQEECAEVTQAISKVFRFGEHSYHPKDKNKVENIKHLESEVGDIMGVLKYLIEENYLDGENIMISAEEKIKRLEEFMKNKKP